MIEEIKANKKTHHNALKNKKNNVSPYNLFLILILLAVCLVIILNPKVYTKSCFDALSVWAISVLPALFPFFVLTRLIVGLISYNPNRLDKLFCKLYNAPQNSAIIYFLSVLSGYPMGAKLLCTQYENGIYTSKDCKHLLALCSVSGPMFMLGTVGIAFLNSYKAGLIILFANILASLVNGLIFRNKTKPNFNNIIIQKENKTTLADCVYDALISILMVGAYIVISFLLIDILKNTGILNLFTSVISKVFGVNSAMIDATIIGFIEMTRGILELGKLNISLALKTIISSGLVGFGGISVFMQSCSFLTKLKINRGYIFFEKIVQGVLATLIAIALTCFL